MVDGEWTLVELQGVVDFIRGVSFDKSQASHRRVEGHLPILRAGNISDELLLDNELVWVPPECVSREQLLQRGDIAICMSSGSPLVVGKTAALRTDWRGSVGAFCGIIRPRTNVSSDFIAHWFRAGEFREWSDSQTRGANIQNLRFSQFATLGICLPPLSEQERIAARLTEQLAAVERARAGAQSRLAAAQALPAAYLREVFQGPEASEWEIVALGDLLRTRIRTGISKPGRPESTKRCLTLSAVRGQTLLLDASKLVDVTDAEAEGSWLRPGCFYVVRGNGNRELVGRGAFAPDPVPYPVLFPDLLFQLDLGNRVDPSFFWCLWSSAGVRNALEERARTAAGIYKINTGNLNSLPVRLPPMAEQKRIAAELSRRLAEAERLAGRIRDQLEAIDALPAALLREAFGGGGSGEPGASP